MTMQTLIGYINIAIGGAYLGLGLIAANEIRTDTKTRGFSHFGAALCAMAFTCGPHHLYHGSQILSGAHPADGLLAIAVAMGVPGAWVFVSLRISVLFGGRGEHVFNASPSWLVATPFLFAAAAGSMMSIAMTKALKRIQGQI